MLDNDDGGGALGTERIHGQIDGSVDVVWWWWTEGKKTRARRGDLLVISFFSNARCARYFAGSRIDVIVVRHSY